MYLYTHVFPKLGRILNSDNMFRSMKRQFCSLDACFGSIYRRFRLMSGQFCSINRQFQLTCLCCTLKIHHNNEHWETKGTLSLRRNHYDSHFLAFLARQNHFGGWNFYAMSGLGVSELLQTVSYGSIHETMSPYVPTLIRFGYTFKPGFKLVCQMQNMPLIHKFQHHNVRCSFP